MLVMVVMGEGGSFLNVQRLERHYRDAMYTLRWVWSVCGRGPLETLLSQSSRDILSQRGQMRRLQEVDTARRGHVTRRLRAHLGPVVYASFRRVTEHQLMALNLKHHKSDEGLKKHTQQT